MALTLERSIESAVDLKAIPYMTGAEGIEVTMPDGSNVRQHVAKVMIELQNKLLESHEDDTRSFFLLISVGKKLSFIFLFHLKKLNRFTSCCCATKGPQSPIS
jgi:hypothetical protein